MPTEAKRKTIEELAAKLKASKGAVLVDYRGLDVAEITRLRRQLAGDEVEFRVAKNTLLGIAAGQAEVEVAPELLIGPTAIAFGWRDEVTPARAMTEYTRRSRIVTIKGGIIGGRSMTADQIARIAELPTRDVLLAQLLGATQAPLAQALGLFQAQARNMAGLLEALRAKKETTEAAA